MMNRLSGHQPGIIAVYYSLIVVYSWVAIHGHVIMYQSRCDVIETWNKTTRLPGWHKLTIWNYSNFTLIWLAHVLKTLFNIVEAPFKKLLNFDVCVVWWCSDGPLNSQEYKSFEIYAVSIKISMTEYHHWINNLVDHLF